MKSFFLIFCPVMMFLALALTYCSDMVPMTKEKTLDEYPIPASLLEQSLSIERNIDLQELVIETKLTSNRLDVLLLEYGWTKKGNDYLNKGYELSINEYKKFCVIFIDFVQSEYNKPRQYRDPKCKCHFCSEKPI